MACCTLDYFSPALDRMAQLKTLIPGGPGPWPVLFLLHGLGGNHTSYVRFHAIERLFEQEPALVVMPDGGRSFYCNEPWQGGLRYEDAIWQDVLELIERVFPAGGSREKRAVMGLSMGGYGALLLALRHADVFGACASVSGSTYFSHEPTDRHQDDDISRLGAALPRDNDLFVLAERLAENRTPLAIRQSCGTEDFLWETNLAWHHHLQSLGVPHEWVLHPGRHDYGTWDVQLPAAARFCLDYFDGGH